MVEEEREIRVIAGLVGVVENGEAGHLLVRVLIVEREERVR